MLENSAPEDRLIYYDQFRALFDDLDIGVFTVDSQRRVTSFNRAVQLLTGYQEEDVVGKYCYQVFHNDLCRGECKFHEAVEAEQTSLTFDVEVFDLNKEKRLITKIVTPLYDSNRKLTGCIEIFQDHSPFEDLINRIRYDERQLKIILDNLDIGVFTITRGDTLHSSIHWQNRLQGMIVRKYWANLVLSFWEEIPVTERLCCSNLLKTENPDQMRSFC